MDGFHLAQPELVRLGRRDRMGAPDTFDSAGYAALLRACAATSPSSTRPSSGARSRSRSPARSPSRSETPLVVTEGNYLLLWPEIKPLLDECWYVETDEELRVQRLIQRHIQFGKTPEYARAWVLRSDEHNAQLVAATADRADVLVGYEPAEADLAATSRASRRPRPAAAFRPSGFSSCRMLPPSTTID